VKPGPWILTPLDSEQSGSMIERPPCESPSWTPLLALRRTTLPGASEWVFTGTDPVTLATSRFPRWMWSLTIQKVQDHGCP
jgi:hypothetical protein